MVHKISKLYGILLAFVYRSCFLVPSADAAEPLDLLLETVKDRLDNNFSRQSQDERCKFTEMKYAYDTFIEPDKYLGDSATVNGKKVTPLLVQTSCFSHGSLGNDLSSYIEARICAHVAGLHFIGATHMDPYGHMHNNTFFHALPAVVRHPNPTTKSVAEVDIRSTCPCPSVCHEWSYGLMHTHMDLARTIFRTAIDAYWKHRDSQMTIDNPNNTRHDLLNLQEMKSKPHIGKNFITYSVDGNKAYYIKANGEKKPEDTKVDTKVNATVVASELISLPTIPDVAVHYRCGDNVVTHYGFTPFHIFAKTIPADSKYIYVLAESPDRNAKPHTVSRCNAIFDALFMYLMDKFKNSFVLILRGHHIFDDLARLTYANTTICSVSTFCLWPSISNTNSAYYPVTKLIAKENTTFNYGPSFHWLKDEEDKAIRGIHAMTMSNSELIKKLMGQ